MDIRTQILGTLVFFGVLNVVILAGSMHVQEGKFEEVTKSKMESVAIDLGDKIDRNLFERYGDAQAFAVNNDLKQAILTPAPDTRARASAILNDYVRLYNIYDLTLVLDKTGALVASNTKGVDGKSIAAEKLASVNFADRSWFKKVMTGDFLKGGNSLSGTVVEQPIRSTDMRAVYGEDRDMAMVFAAPIYDASGAVMGVVANYAGFEFVEDIAREMYGQMKQGGLGFADIAILGPDGTFLMNYLSGSTKSDEYKRDFTSILTENMASPSGQDFEPARLALGGAHGAMESYHKLDQNVNVAGYASLDGAYDFPGLKWAILIHAARDDTYAMVTDIMHKTWMVSGIVLAIMYFGGVMVTRRAVDEVYQLRQMIDQAPINVMFADPKKEFKITYMNNMSLDTLKKIESYLPSGMKAEDVLGKSFDIFHKDPQKQRTLLSNPDNLPHVATIRIGDDFVHQNIQAIRTKAGKYLGPMLTWTITTRQHTMASEFENNVKSVVDVIGSAIDALNSSAQSLSATAEQTLKQSLMVSSASEESSRNTETVAAATEELSSSIVEIARQVERAKDIASQAATESRETNEKVHMLEEAAAKIGNVLELIDDISEKINLLALNATIEAARAGEAGKGFAVVASEVKNLAGQATLATEDIAKQITNIQRATKQSVEAMGHITTTITEINEIQTYIASAVEQQTVATKEISQNVQQASAGTYQIAHTIGQVRSGAEQMEESISNIAMSTGDLAAQGEKLSAAVDHFMKNVRSV